MLIVAVMNNAVVLLNLPVAYQQIMMACVILGAMLLDRIGRPARALWGLFRNGQPR